MSANENQSASKTSAIREEILQLENFDKIGLTKEFKKKIVGYLNSHFGLQHNQFVFKPNQIANRPGLGLLELTTPKKNSVVWLYELLTPLHATYIDVSRHNPRAAREILYQDYYLPDKTLGTDVSTIFHYYNRGASVLVDLGDYDRAYEFLTIAVAARFRTGSAKAFERLLLVSLLTKNHARNEISRHVPKTVFERNKTVLYKYSRLSKPFQQVFSGSRGPGVKVVGDGVLSSGNYAYLDDLVSRNYRQEVLLLVRMLRERKLRNFDKVYLSVGDVALGRADTDAKTFLAHSLRVHCVDAGDGTGAVAWAAAPATGVDDKWSSNAGPSSTQAQQLTKEYVYWLILSGALDATVEEEEATSSNEYTVTLNHETSSQRGQDLTAQITRLHKLLNEVTTVAGVMAAAGREVVVPRVSGKRIRRAGKAPGRAPYIGDDYNDKPIMTPSISFTDLLAMGVGGGSGDDDAATAAALADPGLFGFEHGVKSSFRHIVEDAADIETDTSGVDTIDED
ncbi:hypothetical protein D0Z00_002679 [Geotrichum galactomycetum]|uniref:Uncharacterized protein n=1 Tax=Geotrichum galactomycetum TaxID=27317 RepID=A0ACB6V3D6_9ASCO|nr:hypothetical protein D0Z00_002679 [Geotrichum candidum]